VPSIQVRRGHGITHGIQQQHALLAHRDGEQRRRTPVRWRIRQHPIGGATLGRVPRPAPCMPRLLRPALRCSSPLATQQHERRSATSSRACVPCSRVGV
jgi:hypothetical protein